MSRRSIRSAAHEAIGILLGAIASRCSADSSGSIMRRMIWIPTELRHYDMRPVSRSVEILCIKKLLTNEFGTKSFHVILHA